MAKAEDLMPKFPMTTVTPHKVIATLMQVNNPWDPSVVEDVPEIETMKPKVPDNDIIRQAMKCGRGKSAGMDEVPPFLWYCLPDDIFKHVCDIIRVILKGSYYPSLFKDTRVFPLYKKGDPLEAKAWRPISITNALYRIVFKLMYQQLYEHLEPQLHPLQFGARKNRSCAQTTLVMEGMIDFFKKNNPQQNVFLGLLDIKNAFTSVPIHLLMRVMQRRGVPLEWLSMYF
jgi:Retron-type reverse transcriptase